MTAGRETIMSRKHKWLFVALFIAAGILVAGAYAVFFGGGEVTVIPMSEALGRIRGGEKVVLLDVRTPEEHASGHLPDSLLLTLDVAGGFGSRIGEVIPDKGATVFVYCRSGNRSMSAAGVMARMGYRNVCNIGGTNDVPENMLVR